MAVTSTEIKTQACAPGSEGAYGCAELCEGMKEPVLTQVMNEARKDIAVTLTVKAEGMNEETKECLDACVKDYSAEHHLSVTPYPHKKCCQCS